MIKNDLVLIKVYFVIKVYNKTIKTYVYLPELNYGLKNSLFNLQIEGLEIKNGAVSNKNFEIVYNTSRVRFIAGKLLNYVISWIR